MCDCHGEAALPGGLAQETPLRAGRPAASRPPRRPGRAGASTLPSRLSSPPPPLPREVTSGAGAPRRARRFPRHSAGAAVVPSRRRLAADGARLRGAGARRLGRREVAAPGLTLAAAGGPLGGRSRGTGAGGGGPRCLLPPLPPVGSSFSCRLRGAASSAERPPRGARAARRQDLLRGSLLAGSLGPFGLTRDFRLGSYTGGIARARRKPYAFLHISLLYTCRRCCGYPSHQRMDYSLHEQTYFFFSPVLKELMSGTFLLLSSS